MSLTINIVTSRSEMREFIRLPYSVYSADPLWVAPLEREVRRTLDGSINPYFRNAELRLFLARRDGRPVARLAVVFSRAHERQWGERVAFFGFFESSERTGAPQALFAAAEEYCRANEMAAIEGPFNPCHFSELGMQVDCFDQPQRFFQTRNPSWYNDIMSSIGFGVSSRKLTMRNGDCSRKGGMRALAVGTGRDWGDLRARTFDARNASREFEAIRGVFNASFAGNWHFIASSADEFSFGASMLKYVTEPELIVLVEHRGEPVAVAVLVLDVNPLLRPLHGRISPLVFMTWHRRKRHLRGLVLFATGILPHHRNSRTSALLAYEVARVAIRYDTLETTWISQDNYAAISSARYLGMVEDRHFDIYRKEVTA